MRKHFLFMLLLAAVPFCTSCRGDEPASSEEPDPPVRLRLADPDATPATKALRDGCSDTRTTC